MSKKKRVPMPSAKALKGIASKVDDTHKLNVKFNKLKKDLDDGKKEIKGFASYYNQDEVLGVRSKAKISSSGKSFIDPIDFINFLKDRDELDTLANFISINLGDAQKYFGESALEDIVDSSNINAYGTVRFSKK